MEFVKDKETEFSEYYRKYYQITVNYIMRKIQNYQDAEDLAMTCFAKCYENFDMFDKTKAKFQTWLFTVVNNRIKNYYRDHRYGDEIDETLASDEKVEDTVVEAEYLSHIRLLLKNALSVLNERQRKLVVMKYFKNMDSNAIAQALDMTPGNVRVMLSRTLEYLRDYFKKNNIELEL